MVTPTVSDRAERVDFHHEDTQAYLLDTFNWVRDLSAKAAREVSDVSDDWSKELAELELPVSGSLKEYLRQKDSWVASLFAEILELIEAANPLALGKTIMIWVLEDVRDILRALALLIDTEEDTSEQTQDALMELALAAAALVVPYIGRAGKIVARFARGINSFEEVLKMLRHISPGDAIKYLKGLNLTQHAGVISGFIQKIMDKVARYVGKYMPKVHGFISKWVNKIRGWIKGILGKVQEMIDKAIATLQRKWYEAASNMSNSNLVDKMPDQVLDWVAAQINGNLCESCVDNYFVSYLQYTRLFPKKDESKRDKSAFFGPDQGIDGIFELPTGSTPATPGNFPTSYSGMPLSLGSVLEELNLELPGAQTVEEIAKAITAKGTVPAVFKDKPGAAPSGSGPGKAGSVVQHTDRPKVLPRFVVMEAKWGFHGGTKTELRDEEWKGRLKQTSGGGMQMSDRWIDRRLDYIYPIEADRSMHLKRAEIERAGYARWLYGCQPHKAGANKKAQPRGGKARKVQLAYFPPYALRGFDIDGMKWKV